MKLVPLLKKIVTKSTGLRIMARNTLFAMKNVRYRANGVSVKVDEKLLIFGAYNGKSYACSPKAVYEYMIGQEQFREYKFIWIFDKPEEYKFLEENHNTKVINIRSKECEKGIG